MAGKGHLSSRRGRRSLTPFLLLCLWALWAGGPPPPAWRRECPPPVLLDLNSLGARELTLVPGFGPRRAEAVLRERARGGPFASPAELAKRVKGIGPALATRLDPFLR